MSGKTAASREALKVFISYRRDDSSGHAGHLYADLRRHFGEEQVFMDIDTIDYGEDFAEVIGQAVGSCDVLLALIGKRWLDITNEGGQRRLDNPEDFVRIEIAAALSRNVRVIPVLVHGAAMPREQDLPEPLKKLTRRQALDISDHRWEYDVARLVRTIENVAAKRAPAADAATPDDDVPAGVAANGPGVAANVTGVAATDSAERLAAWGASLFEQKRWPEAAEAYRTALKYHPGVARWYYMLGSVLAAQGHSDDAEDAIKCAIKLAPKETEFRHGYAGRLRAQRRWPEAAAQFEAILVVVPDDEKARAGLEEARGQHARALELYDEGKRLAGEANRLDEALECFRQAREIEPGLPDIVATIANAMTRRDNQRVLDRLLAKLKEEPDNAQWHVALGKFYEERGNSREADAAFKNAEQVLLRLAETEKTPQRYADLGDAYFEAANFKAASAAYLSAAKLEPRSPRRHFDLGKAYFFQRDYRVAARHFKATLKLDPTNTKARGLLTQARERHRAYLRRVVYRLRWFIGLILLVLVIVIAVGLIMRYC